ncbi:DUF3987 domain-containing protein [Roseofilum casamattae]|uniref:DUF3987 domain-containing protein n=1 Tax=Roseofilum casamattae BLCC-M143 TaxID=3022442 RepID=A0ABT7C4J7_9CYAN|nr:DUF3987 domain-containing protein [Roseofilum casamattae]MDJ1185869.1 DUF3987 domain-containing protein [Roseofilum casamattae BLCC-M143]
MYSQQFDNFDNDDIRQYWDALEKSQSSRSKRICPICGGNDLDISKDGKFQCFSGGCDPKEIFIEVKKLAGAWVENGSSVSGRAIAILRPKSQPKLARYQQPLEASPGFSRDQKGNRQWHYTKDFKVVRYDKPPKEDGGKPDKEIVPYENGKSGKKSDWPIYNLDAILSSSGVPLFVEGEGCVDGAAQIGVVAGTFQGASWSNDPKKKGSLKSQLQPIQGHITAIAFLNDNDRAGRIKQKDVVVAAEELGILAIPIDIEELWPKCPKKGDIADWIASGEASVEKLERLVSRGLVEAEWRSHSQEGKVATLPSSQPPNLEELTEEILESQSQSQKHLKAIASGVSNPRELLKAAWYREQERSAREDLEESFEGLKNLDELKQFGSLSLHNIFPEPIAIALESKANADKIDPMMVAQASLPIIASRISPHFKIQMKEGATRKDDWLESAVIYSLTIAPPSSGKSASTRPFDAALEEIQNELDDERADCLRRLHSIVEPAWKALSDADKEAFYDSDRNPEVYADKYCRETSIYLDRPNSASLTSDLAKNPPYTSVLARADEFVAFARGLDGHVRGRGEGRPMILSYWNGAINERISRVGGKRIVKGATLSLNAYSQPEKLSEFSDIMSDSDGFLSRMLISFCDRHPEYTKDWDDRKVNVYEPISELIRTLSSLEPQLIRFSADAAWRLRGLDKKYRQGIVKHEDSNPALSYYLGKQRSYIGRFSLILHLIDHACGLCELGLVTKEQLERAIELSKYYIGQFQLLQAHISAVSGDRTRLEGLLFEVLQLSKRAGDKGIGSRDITNRQRFRNAKWNGQPIKATQCQQIFHALANQGYGEMVGKRFYAVNLESGEMGQDASKCVKNASPSNPDREGNSGSDASKCVKNASPSNPDRVKAESENALNKNAADTFSENSSLNKPKNEENTSAAFSHGGKEDSNPESVRNSGERISDALRDDNLQNPESVRDLGERISDALSNETDAFSGKTEASVPEPDPLSEPELKTQLEPENAQLHRESLLAARSRTDLDEAKEVIRELFGTEGLNQIAKGLTANQTQRLARLPKTDRAPKHGDRILYRLDERDDFDIAGRYVGPARDDRHWVCKEKHFTKGMKGSTKFCSHPRSEDFIIQELE